MLAGLRAGVRWTIYMAITPEEIAREKKRLPRGWGRFGKSLDRLADISEPNETLLSSCVGLNPSFEHRPRGVAVSGVVPVRMLAGGLYEMTQTTNVVLAITNERLIAVGSGFGGAPRDHGAIPLEGLEIVSQAKKEFVVRWPEGEMRIRGAAKQQVPDFLETLAAQARPPSAEVKD